jgi:biotin carboxyl carrier protein
VALMALTRFIARTGEGVAATDHEVSVERDDGRYVVELDGRRIEVDAHKLEGDFFSILIGDRSYEVSVERRREGYHVRHGASERLVAFSDRSRRAREALGGADGPARVVSVMPGKVVRVLAAAGDAVTQGQGLVVVEAMKMENEIAAPKDGTLKSVDVQPGQAVEAGALLAVVE